MNDKEAIDKGRSMQAKGDLGPLNCRRQTRRSQDVVIQAGKKNRTKRKVGGFKMSTKVGNENIEISKTVGPSRDVI